MVDTTDEFNAERRPQLHFTYQDAVANADLAQGDILRRSAAMDRILEDFYPKLYEKGENEFFVVLTQSCDLRRRSNGPTARYIALAPARPFDVAVRRKLAELQAAAPASTNIVRSERDKNRLQLWLERLLNNNEPEYFYLHREPSRGLPKDYCAFLALSIAIKCEPNYSACVDARFLSLAEAFQTKLGWLVGQMYSRVGTKDWPNDARQRIINDVLGPLSLWVPERKLKPLTVLIADWQEKNPGANLDRAIVQSLMNKIPRRRAQVVDRIVSVLREYGYSFTDEQETRLKNDLRGDVEMKQLLPED